MAYEVRQPLGQDDEQQAQQEQQASTGYQPPPAAQSQAQGNIPGDKFVNFDRILGANQGVAQRESNNIANRLTGQAQSAQSAITGLAGNFNQAVTNASTLQPMNTHGTVFGQDGSSQAAPGAKGPSMLPGTYQGPSDITQFTGWKPAVDQASKSDADLAAAAGPGGLGALEQRQSGAGANYTQGMQNEDAALMGAVSGNRFADLNQKYGHLGAMIDKTSTDANANAAGARDRLAANQQGIRDTAANNEAYFAGKAKDDAAAAAAAADTSDPTGDDIKKQIASLPPNDYIDHSAKGEWNQIDGGSPFAFLGSQPQTDAGNFDQAAKSSGMTGNQPQELYAKLSKADIEELRWIYRSANGLTGTSKDWQQQHVGQAYPGFQNLPPGADYDVVKKQLEAQWLERMRKKYGV